MQIFVGLSLLALVAVSATVGFRLVRLARRTGGLPEGILGLGLVAITSVGFPVLLLTEAEETITYAGVVAADAVGSLSCALGFASFYLFTWKVFRPGAAWARALAGVGCVALVVNALGTVLVGASASHRAEAYLWIRNWEIAYMATAAVGFAWSGAEALLYHARLRQRLALGLADRVVVNRVLLFAMTGITATIAMGVVLALRLMDVNYLASTAAQLSTAACGLGVSACLYLAFLPPAAYLRRLRAER